MSPETTNAKFVGVSCWVVINYAKSKRGGRGVKTREMDDDGLLQILGFFSSLQVERRKFQTYGGNLLMRSCLVDCFRYFLLQVSIGYALRHFS